MLKSLLPYHERLALTTRRYGVDGHRPRYSEACLAGVIAVILIAELFGSLQTYHVANDCIQSIDYGLYPLWEQVDITYVAANETSQELFVKLQSVGTRRTFIEHVLVNDAEARTIPSLPFIMWGHVDYVTLVIHYKGSWDEPVRLNIVYGDPYTIGYTDEGETYGYYVTFAQTIDLHVSSQNPIRNAYPSESEALKIDQFHHRWEILRSSVMKIGILTPVIVGLLVFVTRALCPRTPSLAGGLIVMWKSSPYDTSIALGVVACLLFAGYLCVVPLYHGLPFTDTRWPEPEIVYVAADATTGELACKIFNAMDRSVTITAIDVNATHVTPRAPLPVILPSGEYATVVLPYSGPWNGLTQITLDSRYYNYSQEVDLDAASTNPMGGAYPTPVEVLAAFLHQHVWELRFAVVVALLLTVIAGSVVLRKRGRVSLLVLFDEVLAFGIYFFVLAALFFWAMPRDFLVSLFLILCCSGLSVFTVYALLTPSPRTPSAYQPSE